MVFVSLGMASVAVQGAMSDDAFIELCKKGTAREVREALASGANINSKDEFGKTALMFAAQHNPDSEVVKALLAGGADINARDNVLGMTALMWAA